ncbi:coenzyme F420-0:L-glutamate ligase [Poseidonocella sedimentorum]|uniref:Coenzyme F420-0 gamma-glutamyl ligase n=1 Tax=Poseidonocella sedimentorum TaxID=871652 RepID=A0A1I6E3Z1_9RHOB|nr:coenzyme F420-0:L-glutamate ligase [Poseidonocella sedimentorum]SFR12416.1 coenzyme F420-0 gamma-glutamyl ligase [Poseidonocella sedimentorum]
MSVTLTALPGIPDIAPGDDLAAILGDALEAAGGVAPGDILCLAHKIVSKAEGCVIRLADVTPSPRALELAAELNKEPEKVEVVLRQSRRVVRAFKRPAQTHGTMICEHKLGLISANAAVDESNADPGTVITLPDDPDASARGLGEALAARFGMPLGVVITDTFGRPWRLGQVNVAIGLHLVPAKASEIGNTDAWGKPLVVTEPALCDEIAAASGLVVQKAAKTPAVLFRGVDWTPDPSAAAAQILRPIEEDMFR